MNGFSKSVHLFHLNKSWAKTLIKMKLEFQVGFPVKPFDCEHWKSGFPAFMILSRERYPATLNHFRIKAINFYFLNLCFWPNLILNQGWR